MAAGTTRFTTLIKLKIDLNYAFFEVSSVNGVSLELIEFLKVVYFHTLNIRYSVLLEGYTFIILNNPSCDRCEEPLVCDNLNTHTRGAFYEAFPAEEARKLVKRFEFRYTPKHGSWLNVSENELSSMTRQCLKDRKMVDIEMLQEETRMWSSYQNEKQRGVDWQFKVDDARTKLKSLCPKSKV